jgi:hypothetical protein
MDNLCCAAAPWHTVRYIASFVIGISMAGNTPMASISATGDRKKLLSEQSRTRNKASVETAEEISTDFVL